MKKLCAFILALIVCFGAVACSSAGDDISDASSPSVAEATKDSVYSQSLDDTTSVDTTAESSEETSESSEESESSEVSSVEESSSTEISETSEPEETSSESEPEVTTSESESSVEESSSNISTPPVTPPVTPPAAGSEWINALINQQDRDYHGYDPAVLDDYFDGAVFAGDSVANGLKLYTQSYEKIFTGMIYHTGACYGFHNCLSPISEKSMHPLYQGQKRTLWDMVSITGTDKIFIGFGLNDFGCTTKASVTKCLDRIKEKIYAANPDVEIIILSSGYFTKQGSSYKPELNDFRTSARQRDYNQHVLEYCNSNGWDYIDVTNCFSDQNGDLDAARSLDNYCHPKIKEYTEWRDILYSYAAAKLMGTYENPPTMK